MFTNMPSKVQKYDTAIQNVEQLITKCYPEKIVELNELLGMPMFKPRDLEELRQELCIPVLPPVLAENHCDGCIDDQPQSKRALTDVIVAGCPAVTCSPVPCNKTVCEMIKVVQTIVRTLIKQANFLNMWITVLTIQSGSAICASIQEDINDEFKKIELNAIDCFKMISEYFAVRDKTLALVAKYPHAEEHRKAVVEIDEKTCLSLTKVVCDVRNNYSLLIDVATKNWIKLKSSFNANTYS
ncbi:proteasome activator complex subunit 3-like [Drosophila obscura]|uniref:proteasome activator complex subunit 3-like n=1 Tax=Drosophila obscura TaxID=7282 RepID=UPI001BB26120|nr:proteasome activator complex subunit 3-like [Drosophila obscura]